MIAALLLPGLTANPPVGAAPLSVIVQWSVPAPVIDELAQLSPLSTGALVPTRLESFSCRSKASSTPPALATRVTVCAVVTAETSAVKLADVDPPATVADAGTATAVLLLARLTAIPPSEPPR